MSILKYEKIQAADIFVSFGEREFMQQLTDPQHYLHDTAEPGAVQENIKAIPVAETVR